eukprot:294688-Pelagomonas_calceolata.AAC.1
MELKIQLMRHRIPAITLEKNPARGVSKGLILGQTHDVGCWHSIWTSQNTILGEKTGTRVELWALLGRSEAWRVIWCPPIFIIFWRT